MTTRTFLACAAAGVAVLAISGAAAAGAEAAPDGAIASPEAGWPQWRGPRRDAVSDETGLLEAWPEGGPRLLWTASGLGRGWSSPIITGGRIYITGDVGGDLRLFALDLDGKKKWEAASGKAWDGPSPGARASCAYSAGRLYHMNAHGRIACFDAANGREVWAVDMLDRFAGRPITWGISECVLVDGPRVIVTPGGDKAFMAALDAKTGATVWASKPLDDPKTQRTGYASPILLRLGGRRVLVNLALRGIVCVDADKGVLYDLYPKRSKYDASCATPVFYRGGIFHSLPSTSGSVLLRLAAGAEGVRFEKAWESPMDNLSGGVVPHEGFFYGSGEDRPGWVCIDARTGEQKYVSKDLEQGAVVYGDGRLYCLGEKGHMTLVRPGPQKFDILSRFSLTDGKQADVWAHPVILDRRLYLRYHDNLYCYDIRRPDAAAAKL